MKGLISHVKQTSNSFCKSRDLVDLLPVLIVLRWWHSTIKAPFYPVVITSSALKQINENFHLPFHLTAYLQLNVRNWFGMDRKRPLSSFLVDPSWFVCKNYLNWGQNRLRIRIEKKIAVCYLHCKLYRLVIHRLYKSLLLHFVLIRCFSSSKNKKKT